MNGGYKKAMDGIRFSEAAKERMARNLVAAQGASHAPVASATRQARERTPVRARAGGKRRWQAVAAAAAAVGVLAGNKLGSRFQARAQLLGGAVLILMGCKIQLEHLGILFG